MIYLFLWGVFFGLAIITDPPFLPQNQPTSHLTGDSSPHSHLTRFISPGNWLENKKNHGSTAESGGFVVSFFSQFSSSTLDTVYLAIRWRSH